MAEYYLISQLPSLDSIDDGAPLPINEERFFDLCSRFLNTKTKNELQKITLNPPKDFEKCRNALINAWNEGERNLRFALVRARSEKMKIPCDIENSTLFPQYLQAAKTAVEMESPMEAEIFLNNFRLSFLESLRPVDIFSEDYVYYYAIKLKLLLRIRNFDTESGKEAYKNIYNSVIGGDMLEATV